MSSRIQQSAWATNSLAVGLVVVAGGAIPFEFANSNLPHVEGPVQTAQVVPQVQHLPAAGTALYADIATAETVDPHWRVHQKGFKFYRQL